MLGLKRAVDLIGAKSAEIDTGRLRPARHGIRTKRGIGGTKGARHNGKLRFKRRL
jgi:hypothetical protein